MVFPQTPLDVEIALWIGGTWTDVTADVYTSDKITITRGRADEGARTDPGKCTLTFNNRLGKYSPRNPLSPYYGLIGRNTLLRVLVKAGTPFLELPGNSNGYASTPDVAALDITGDIDVRFDGFLTNWLDASDGLKTTELMGKLGSAGADKSWFFGVRNNRLYFEWSADGTNVVGASSTAQPVVPANGRLAVRATLDVNNGAGGRTIVFYTAPTIAGPWTQLGDPVVQAGTTSIFNSTAAVRVGALPAVMTYPSGRVHAAEIRNGIGGTVVANPDFTAQALAATSFADSAGRTWTVNTAGSTAISNRRTRFIGEVSSWPSRWDVSGKDIRVPIEAAGLMRRLGQGAKALDSTLRRRIPAFAPLAYWPMEEGKNARAAYSPIAGVKPLQLKPANWAGVDSLASSSALPTISSSTPTACDMYGRVPAPSTTLTKWSVEWVYRLDTANTTLRTFLRVLSTGTVREWYVQTRNDLTRIIGKDDDGTTVFSNDLATGTDLFNQWIRVRLAVTQSGGNVVWEIRWTDVGGDAGAFSTSFTGTVGRPTGVASPPDGYASDIDGMAIGHISVFGTDDSDAFDQAIDAWAGETAGARMSRLASEEGVRLGQWGDPTVQEQVGPQRIDTLLSLLEQAADADGGILYERRNAVSLAYRDRNSMYNQPVGLALDYNTSGHVAPPLEPVDDDQKVRNDVTVTRDGGASGRAVLDEGPLSVQAPPNGVGLYDTSLTLNLYDDDQAEPHAYWNMHLGTWDESRYPVVNLDLAAAPSLIDTVTLLESGDRIQIANPPAWLPPGPIDLLMQGYQEVIGHPIDWDVQMNCTPAGPWNIGIVEDPVYGWADTDGCSLAAAATSSATALTVLTTDGDPWTTDPAELPFDIRAGGEVMTVNAISNSLTDTFARTISSSWGTADSGQVWSFSGGSAADYSVGSGYGKHVLASVNVSRRSFTDFPFADFDYYGSVTTSATATGGSLFGSLTGRYIDSDNLYMARLEFTTANALILTIRKRVATVESTVASYNVTTTHTPGTFLRIRFQAKGTALRAKTWLASDPEPPDWQIDTTDTDITTASYIGVRSITASGNTNTNPEVRYDNLAVVNPQVFTVLRARNGIVKAQTASTDIVLAYPAIVAL
ncbi:hypothetical protein [Streptomyces siamensis]|uniref:Minor tail protein n=1 Tax=Streptomyces siamensis TaxID=1274986 RepID=A0ABP9IJ32_9ACTN